MSIFSNLDLLAVGSSIAAIIVLGVAVYYNNQTSITHKSFLLFSFVASFWSVVNYLSYQVDSNVYVLWLLRAVMFFAAWYAYSLFQLFFVFPKEEVRFPKWYKFFILPVVFLTSILVLTPFVFEKLKTVGYIGEVSVAQPGPGIVIFGIVAVGLTISGVGILLVRMFRSEKQERAQFEFILTGAVITFFLHIIFNFVLPAFYDVTEYIPLGALFTFPFVLFTGYSIFKYRMLNVKVIAVEILTFIVVLVTFFEVVFSESVIERLVRIGIFVVLLYMGILLVRGVRKEISQREEVERLAKKLSDFISFATHELRGPITAFKGAISMIMEGNFGKVEDETNVMLNKVYLEAEEMGQTVETFLNMNKIEIGKFDLNTEVQDLTSVVASAVEQSKYRAVSKKVDVKFLQPKKSIPTLSFDQFKIKHAVANLISNAIKYNNEGGKMRVSIYEDDTMVTVKVEDNGVGISSDALPNLFDQYNRGQAETKRFAEGSGIGLWLTKKIVDLHGGRVWAESAGEGKGSSFFLSLPLSGGIEK